MQAGVLGFMATPAQRNKRPEGVTWGADNGCYGKGYPGDVAWLAWLRGQSPLGCLFATAPDVVGDAASTLKRSAPHLPAIREAGFPAALVAQDGLEREPIPWDSFDVLFIGGGTEWKLGPEARAIAAEARGRGLPVHMGRVNSKRRYNYARDIGCTSVDGTYLTFGPDKNLPILLGWLEQAETPDTS